MSQVRVDKQEAARRQIDVAIDLLFSNRDPVAIQTLAAAACRILRDLTGKADDNYMTQQSKICFKPGMEGKLWSLLNRPANFFKHADRDGDAVLDDFDEESNDAMLFLAGLYYQSLGHLLTPEMAVLSSWYIAMHPEFLRDESATIAETFRPLTDELLASGRKRRLEMARDVLNAVRQSQLLEMPTSLREP